jgi:hypothetical protein
MEDMLTSEGSSTVGLVILPAPVAAAAFDAWLRRWLGRATAGVVLKQRVSWATGAVSLDDMAMGLWLGQIYGQLLDGLMDGIR